MKVPKEVYEAVRNGFDSVGVEAVSSREFFGEADVD